jgi:NAD dependent epimerase/dehydratase family enzyme
VLGRVLSRPSFVPTPAFAVRFALGELADSLILGGQRVVPARAQARGYEFTHATLESALRDIYHS